MAKNKEAKQQQQQQAQPQQKEQQPQQQQQADWSTAKVEDIVNRLAKVESENAELKKYLGLLEDRLNKLETSKKTEADKPSMSFNEFLSRLTRVEEENARLRSMLEALEARISALEGKPAAEQPHVKKEAEPAKPQQPAKQEAAKPASHKKEKKAKESPKPVAAAPAPAAKKADDDFDLFGEDEKDAAEKTKVLEDRLHAYQAMKATKPKVVAKSSVLLDVKVWDDTTDMVALEKAVREIQMDGLVWGQAKLVPVAYSVNKLQIACVIEDDKVSTEILEEKITALEDYVQSVDIAAFNKI